MFASDWDPEPLASWDEEAGSKARMQLSAVAIDWHILRRDIEICKLPDGSDWLLGHSTSGKVLKVYYFNSTAAIISIHLSLLMFYVFIRL